MAGLTTCNTEWITGAVPFAHFLVNSLQSSLNLSFGPLSSSNADKSGNFMQHTHNYILLCDPHNNV